MKRILTVNWIDIFYYLLLCLIVFGNAVVASYLPVCISLQIIYWAIATPILVLMIIMFVIWLMVVYEESKNRLIW